MLICPLCTHAKPAAAIQSQGRPIWTVAFHVWQAFCPYVAFLFPSSSEVEAVFDLVPMFLLSSARNRLLPTKEKDSSSFLMNDPSLLVQLNRHDFYGLSLPDKRVVRYFLLLLYSAGS